MPNATPVVTEIPLHATDATLTAWNAKLADQMFFAIVHGAAGDETFDAASLTAPTRALMDTYKRGITVDLGAGNDTVVGSAYGDSIAMGAGTDMIDGGTNLGIPPGGGNAIDALEVYVADQAHADALAVTTLDANATGADATAFTGGYSFKVVNGTGVAYVKNIEQINVRLTTTREFIKSIALAVHVNEIANPSSADLANYVHYAWASGTAQGDTFNAATDISAATQTLMTDHGRGVYIDLGAGNDTVTGSAFGDYIIVGSGTNYVDGGANGGTPPWGGKGQDVLQVTVADQAAADALQVTALSTSSGSAEDKQAATNGYAYKVLNAADGETDYIKNVEKVSVLVKGANGSATFARDIALEVSVREADLTGATSSNTHLAWVNGTAHADAIDLSGDSALLSAALKAKMATDKLGVWVDGGSGDDIITGTAYADVFRNGSDNAKIDGGANEAASGKHGQDVFEIQVANQAEMDAVQVSASDDVNYTWKVSYGTGQVDYLKNVETILVYSSGGLGKWIPLTVNVTEIQDTSATNLNNATHYAWVSGTAQGDNFNAATDISTATKTLMSDHGRGVFVDLGAGNDTIVGSGYGDYLIGGAGTNYIDGGANAGTTLYGGKDVLQVTVANQAAADALQVSALSTTTGSTEDMQAAANGYTHKIVNGGEIDYVKNVERVTAMIAGSSGTSFARDIALQSAPSFSALGGTHDVTGVKPMLIDSDASIVDTDLAASSYQGAHLTLARHGGANADDMFSASGEVSISGTDIKVGTVVVGTVTQAGGSLDIVFNNMASQTLVNRVVQGLSYANSSTPPASVTLDWTFSDGHSTAQGGVALSTSGSTTLNIVIMHSELGADQVTPSTAYLATVDGTAGGDTFDAGATLLDATKALMTQYHKGVQMNMAGGDDSVTGSAYGDLFDLGSGTNHVDGGSGIDTVRVVVNSQAEADAVAITNLDAASSGADAAAFAAGYTRKLVNGAEVDYLKNIEKVDFVLGPDQAPVRQIQYVHVDEFQNGDSLARFYGSDSGDRIDATQDVSAPTLALMAAQQRGVNIVTGAGEDTVTGSAYGDHFEVGAGTKWIDGGANLGHAPGQTAMAIDDMELFVPTVEASNAASATVLDGITGGAADKAAFAAGYVFKLVAGDAIDYVKNVERATISIWVDANHNGVRDNGDTVNWGRNIALGVTTNETQADPGNPGKALYSGATLADEWRLAWVDGSALDDNVDAARDISAASRALMDTYGRGLWLNVGAGNDTVVGSAYGDSFDLGSGTNYLDGGSNLGHAPGQTVIAADELDLFVRTPEAAAALAATPLDGNGSAADNAAFSAGYTLKLVTGDAIDYVKNIEWAHVSVWNDANDNHLRDDGETTSWYKNMRLGLTVDEVTLKEGDPQHTWWGAALSDVDYWATAHGADAGDLFDASQHVSSFTRALMDTYKRGISTDMGGGNDTVVGSAYGDEIVVGSGTNYVNGGANGGLGVGSADVLKVYVSDQATLDAMTLTTLRSTSTGADAAAFAAGYQYKVVAGNETDYLVNMERIEGRIWTDTNKNGVRDWDEYTSYKEIQLVPKVEEHIDPQNPTQTTWNAPLSGEVYLAYVRGSPASDHFDARTDLSTMTHDAILLYGRGVDVDIGDGDNIIVGSDSNDQFTTGHGINMIDGGADIGSKPWGDYGDGLQVIVSSADAGNAIVPIELTGTLDGADAQAQAQGYRFKVVNGDEIDYLKNVEHVWIQAWADKNGNGVRDWDELTWVKGLDLPSSNTAPTLTLSGGAVVHTAGAAPLVLDAHAAAADIDLTARGSYEFASLHLQRSGSSSADDVFGASGKVDFSGGVAHVNGVAIGNFTQSSGVLDVTFTANATQSLVNQLLRSITYANTGTAPDSATIAWSFSDGNWGHNGGLVATGSTIVTTGALGTAGDDRIYLAAGNETVDGGDGVDSAALFWTPVAANGAASLSSATTSNGGTTVITVSQTQQQVTTALLTLTHSGSGTDWTVATVNPAADALIGPLSGALGVDHLSNIETVSIYLQGTGAVTTAIPLEISLVGVPV